MTTLTRQNTGKANYGCTNMTTRDLLNQLVTHGRIDLPIEIIDSHGNLYEIRDAQILDSGGGRRVYRIIITAEQPEKSALELLAEALKHS